MIRRPRLPGSRNRKGDGPRAANDQAAGTSRPSTLSALTFLEFKLGHRVRGGARMIVDGASLDLPAGEMLLFAGPSGAGKSSLLRAILGLDDPYRPRSVLGGELRVLGEAVASPLPRSLRERVGAVFQEGALIDDLSPRDNVCLALEATGRPPAEADRLLERVGLPPPPALVDSLSGGEQKRVALARALARDPELLVIDEPTAGLDGSAARALAELLRRVHDEANGKRTTIVITHDLEAFHDLTERALLIDPRRGTLELTSMDRLDDALARLERPPGMAEPPPPESPWSLRERLIAVLQGVLLAAAAVARIPAAALRHLIPIHLGGLWRALLDQVLEPAPYIAAGCAAAGGLATAFALENNPLQGAFRREVLVGTGKVLVGTGLPLLVGILFAARTAAGAAARLGALRRGRVFEALPLLGISPDAYLLTPLLYSSVAGALILTALGIVSGCLGGLIAASLKIDISPHAWAAATFDAVGAADLRWAAGKALAGGILVALTAYPIGAAPKSSARDVERGTTRAIVWSTLWVLVAHGILTLLEYRAPAAPA